MKDNLKEITKKINDFRIARDWKQFHNPKNLAEAITLEASELLEFYQWKTLEQSLEVSQEKKDAISQEIADIAIYLLMICDEIGIDLLDAMESKIKINNEKYPVSKSKGNSKKYTQL